MFSAFGCGCGQYEYMRKWGSFYRLSGVMGEGPVVEVVGKHEGGAHVQIIRPSNCGNKACYPFSELKDGAIEIEAREFDDMGGAVFGDLNVLSAPHEKELVCSGVLVKVKGGVKVLTAAHCLDESRIRAWDEKEFPGWVVIFGRRASTDASEAGKVRVPKSDWTYVRSVYACEEGRDEDWALIDIDLPDGSRDVTPLELSSREEIGAGEVGWLFAHPMGLPLIKALAVKFGGFRDHSWGYESLSSSGSSGGAVVIDGEVIGVHKGLSSGGGGRGLLRGGVKILTSGHYINDRVSSGEMPHVGCPGPENGK
ncbi:trypsin-like peptidase domain-containing protein [Pseudenhygromyxa sp. WMMC2535]|uniref:trypsin-like serine peptidase n=1 Tax=Pseudenhygromyxa sp. WMMC2535 TaxID=2712867 RepID=UPI0031F86B8B